MDHVGFSPTRQTLLAPIAKRREVFSESHEGLTASFQKRGVFSGGGGSTGRDALLINPISMRNVSRHRNGGGPSSDFTKFTKGAI